MRKISAIILTAIILISSAAPIATASSFKEEVVYGLLNHDGSVDNLYVVNIFQGGSITDYGDYDKVINLTTNEQLTQNNDMITIDTKADRFYYQGNLISKELPWNIDIKYYLNDKELAADALAGKSGKLKIAVSIGKNPSVNSSFYDNFGLQIAVLLDNKLCSNIIAENATIAEAAGSKQINFTVLSGKPFEGTVSADVKDFEMDPISINAIRLAFDIDIDSNEFTNRFGELIEGIKSLDEGAGELLSGINELADGLSEYADGVKAFNNGIKQLSTGVNDLYTGISSLSTGLSELVKQNENINNGAVTIQNMAFDAINAQLQGMGLGFPALTPDNYESVLSGIQDLNVLKLQLDGIVQFVQGLKSYTDGVAQLNTGADELTEGTGKFKDSVGEITASSDAIYEGAVRIHSGIKELRDGMAAYKEGTNEFRSKTSGIDTGIDEQINEILDDILGSDESLGSFTSEKNTNTSSVQFVLKTPSIKLPVVENHIDAKPVKLTFWQRLLKLFGLYK